MGQPAHHHKVNYIEFTTTDVAKAKAFYSTVFGWQFQDWGPDYASFTSETAAVDGGFRKGEPAEAPPTGAVLVVLYSAQLSTTEEAIRQAGGTIVVPTFSFPGGKRFHFADGCGNVLAVWSEQE